MDKYQNAVLRREHPITISYKTKVARTIFYVFLSFVVCRIPFTALIFIRGKMGEMKDQVDEIINTTIFISRFLTYLNAAINPVIYGLTNDNFRKAFRSTTLCKWFFRMKAKTCTNKVTKQQNFNVSWIEQHRLKGDVNLINNDLGGNGTKDVNLT